LKEKQAEKRQAEKITIERKKKRNAVRKTIRKKDRRRDWQV
jgi:hypothetical protein